MLIHTETRRVIVFANFFSPSQKFSNGLEVLARFGSHDSRQAFLVDMEAVLSTAPDNGDADVLALLTRSLAP